jgi:hypothetical protein
MSTFDIETYLQSLPEDTEEIVVSFKNLTYIPELTRFRNIKTLDCSNNQLTKLPALNETLTFLECSNNRLMSGRAD